MAEEACDSRKVPELLPINPMTNSIEDKVIGIDSAKRLVDLDVLFPSEYVWFDADISGPQLVKYSELSIDAQTYSSYWPAYNIQEMSHIVETLAEGINALYKVTKELI